MLPSVLTAVLYKGITSILWKLGYVQNTSLTGQVTMLTNSGWFQAERSSFIYAPKKWVSCQLVSEWLGANVKYLRCFCISGQHEVLEEGAFHKRKSCHSTLSNGPYHRITLTGTAKAEILVCKVWCKVFVISKSCTGEVSRKIQSSRTGTALWDIVLYVENFLLLHLTYNMSFSPKLHVACFQRFSPKTLATGSWSNCYKPRAIHSFHELR